MREALLYLLPCVYAFLACIGFSMLFNIHGAGMLICAGGGALGWLCYLLTGPLVRYSLFHSIFAALLRALGRTGDAAALNRAYLDHLGEGSYLLPGAQALCRALAPRCTLAIVTNGVARAQRRRFEASPLNGLIPWLFISEELGASKPDSAFFAPVLRTLGNPDPRRVLMEGDNLLADIQGGIQAGLDTAWYNPGRLPGDPAIVPTWEVDGYAALQALILKEE